MHYLWPWNIRDWRTDVKTNSSGGAKATAVYHAASTCLIVIFINHHRDFYKNKKKYRKVHSWTKQYSKSDDHVRIWQAKENHWAYILALKQNRLVVFLPHSITFTMCVTCKYKYRLTFKINKMFFTCSQLRLLDCNGFGDNCRICDIDPSYTHYDYLRSN